MHRPTSRCGRAADRVASEPEAAAITIAVVTPYLANVTTNYVIDRFQAAGEAKGWTITVNDIEW